jgi:hypothetical protein
MSKADEFTSILMALQGVTVLEAPRVSRETIISSIRDHTLILREMKKGLTSVTQIVTSLAAEAGDNRRILQNLQDDNKKMRTDIEKLYTLSDEFRKEMNEMGEKVSDLYALKDTVREHKEFVDDLNSRFGVHVKETRDYERNNDERFDALDGRHNQTVFNLKELKDYVEHFADNLILPSSQITVEAAAGYATRPTPLLEILKMVNETDTDQNTQLKLHSDQILASQEKIETKADDSVLHDVKGLTRKVTAIENHILKEEEQGVGAIRRACEELSDKMQGMTTEMAEKMDRREVSFIVHEKYEEIVKYLQDALQSSAEDENNFKEKADEIQALVMTLSNTKADRVEIAPMQEILVKTEVMLKKLGGGNKRDQVSKKELEALLELKVDKQEFETALSSMSKGNKRGKRLTALGPSAAPVLDEAFGTQSVPMGGNTSHYDNNNLADLSRDKEMWKNIANSMKDESEEAILRAAYKAHTAGGGNNSEFSAFVLSKKAQASTKNISTMSLPNHSIPGSFRKNSEQGNAGGVNLGSRPGTSDRPQSNHGYAGDVGQPGGPSDLYKNNGSIVETSKQHYPHVPPEGTEILKQKEFHPEDSGEHIQDMAFIGAPVAGGGFNQRDGGGLKNAQMKTLMGSQPNSTVEPVTGLGVMVKGEDNKFYITDDRTSPHQHNKAKNAPTAYSKPVNQRKSQ